MNRGILFILLGLALANCKKDEPEEIPQEISGIVGKWRSVEYTQMMRDSTVTGSIPRELSRVIIFRFDGVMLEENGMQSCGTPNTYLLNNHLITVKPHAPVPTTMDCTGMTGARCPEHFKINQSTTNEIVTEYCSVRLKYVREE